MLSREDLFNIHDLLAHENLEFVKQGIQLFEGVVLGYEKQQEIYMDVLALGGIHIWKPELAEEFLRNSVFTPKKTTAFKKNWDARGFDKETAVCFDNHCFEILFKSCQHQDYLSLWALCFLETYIEFGITFLQLCVLGNGDAPFREFPENFGNLNKSLTHLQILNTSLEAPELLPIFEMDNLICLEFRERSRGSHWPIPEEIGNLVKLRQFKLSYNYAVQTVPASFSKLVNLEVLQLEACALKKIPDVIFGLKKLEVLKLGNNNITEIPDDIGKLVNLTQFWVNSNTITDLPDILGYMELNMHVGGNYQLPNRLLYVGNSKGLRMAKGLPEPEDMTQEQFVEGIAQTKSTSLIRVAFALMGLKNPELAQVLEGILNTHEDLSLVKTKDNNIL